MFCLLCYDPSYFDFVSLGSNFSSLGFISPFFPRFVLETFIECLDFYVFLEKTVEFCSSLQVIYFLLKLCF